MDKLLLNQLQGLNWNVRNVDSGKEYYVNLPMENELVLWENELAIKNIMFETEVVISLNPTLEQLILIKSILELYTNK